MHEQQPTSSDLTLETINPTTMVGRGKLLSWRTMDFLMAVHKYPGKSIRHIGKHLGIDYKNAYKYAHRLIDIGLLIGIEKTISGRRHTILSIKNNVSNTHTMKVE